MIFRRKQREHDLERELCAHLDLEAQEQSGDPYAARRALGNPALIKEDVREAWGWIWLDRLWQDLRYAARILRHSPGFTAVAVLSLALGIGANTALFSALDAVLWKSLPVPNPRDLRILTWVVSSKVPLHSHSGYNMRDPRTGEKISGSFSYAGYRALQEGIPQFSDLVAFAESQFTVAARGSSDYAMGQFVSQNYFAALGVAPYAGRLLGSGGNAPAVVLTYRFWEKRFGLDPGIIGREIVINRHSATVIGITPPVFQGLQDGLAIDLFVPISMVPDLGPRYYSLTDPYNWWVQAFGRLRPGASDRVVASEAQAILTRVIQDYAGPPTANVEVPRVLVQPGGQGVHLFAGHVQQSLYVLAAVVAAVLLMACLNLANLLLARSEARRREVAVRLSIGADRGRLIRQLLTESLVLSCAAGASGVLLAKPLLAVVIRMIAGSDPLTLDARLDARALLFTLFASFFTGVLFGVLPAWRATRVDLTPALKDAGSAADGRARRKTGGILVAAQVAFSVVLLAGAGLFLRTLVNLLSVNIGIRADHLLTFQTDASPFGYQGQRLADLYADLRVRLESTPGVESVGMSHRPLLNNGVTNTGFFIPGRTLNQGPFRSVHLLYCSDSFLSTMHIAVVLGRDLSGEDRAGAPLVAVVNEAFAREYLGGENPIGIRIVLGEKPKVGDQPIEIVGVARDAHYSSVRADVPPTAYIPFMQHIDHLDRMAFAIRTNVQPLAIASAVRKRFAERDPSLPVAEMRTMDDQVSESIHTERLFAGLVSGFGALASLLAAIGLFGVMAYSVARRTREIGIRLALGATPGGVRWMVLREGMVIVAVGLAVGLPSALALSRLVETMLYGLKPHDAASFTLAALVMAGIAAAAAWSPARRASGTDPVAALRCA